MELKFSKTLSRFNEPETLRMAKLARELREKGNEVIDLSIGEPDFNIPQHIKLAGIKAIEENYSHYPPVTGYPELKKAICNKLETQNKLTYLPENVIASTGAKQSIANLILALIDENYETIIPAPYWVTYSEIVKLAGGKVITVQTKVENGYKMTAQELEQAITPQTRLFMFSSPCNPSGAFYSKSELEALVKVFEKNPHVYIMSDEIYEHINYTGQHESIAQFESIKSRVIIINGMSKGFAMTGWRLGYLVAANTDIIKACEKIQGQFTSGANTIAQRASIEALNGSLEPTQEMEKEFKKRKEFIVDFFNKMEGVTFAEPDGAFYIFPNMSSFFGKKTKDGKVIANADDMCFYFLNYAFVSSVSGASFGTPECVRFSFANSLPNIQKALEKIESALKELH